MTYRLVPNQGECDREFELSKWPKAFVYLAKSLAHKVDELTLHPHYADVHTHIHKMHPDDANKIALAFHNSTAPIYVGAAGELDDIERLFPQIAEMNCVWAVHDPIAEAVAGRWLSYVDSIKHKTSSLLIFLR